MTRLPSDVRIRELGPEDVAELLGFYRSLSGQDAFRFTPWAITRRAMLRHARDAAAGRAISLVAVDGRQAIVAHGFIRHLRASGSKPRTITNRVRSVVPAAKAGLLSLLGIASRPRLGLGVHESLRGRGLGGLILGRLIEEAGRRGLDAVTLGVHKDNALAVALYRKHGFLVVGEIGQQDANDSYEMELRIGRSERRATSEALFSIVVPTCNRCEVLSRCLDALAGQSHRRFEIIVVDDCSTDGTPDVLHRFGAAHPDLRLKLLRNERHAGANPSRNRGIAAAEGELVAFLDCDCIARPDWLKHLARPFEDGDVAAVTGVVEVPPARNVYELAFKGTNRVHLPRSGGAAPRLVAGNLCVRREELARFSFDEDRATPLSARDGSPDVSVSGRGDEEGLFLSLKAAGRAMRVAPEAIVLHDHPLDRRSFYRQAHRGGRAAARLVYKYRLPPRLDMLPFMLAYGSLPLALVDRRLGLMSGCFFAAGVGAIIYNDLFRKAKTIGETIRSFGVLLAYYHVRLAGYVLESLRLRLSGHGLRHVKLRRS